MPSHELIDQRSLALGRALAAHITEHPELIHAAKSTLARWLLTCSPGARPALLEWQSALNDNAEAVLSILTTDDARSIQLRQSNPFAGLLPESKRLAILRQYQAHDAAST